MRVLVAYDGSAGAAQAVTLVESIDWPSGSVIRVASVVEPAALQVLRRSIDAVAPELVEQEALAGVEADQIEIVRRLSTRNRLVDAVLLRDRPASGLVDHARAFSADLIITGSRGHGQIATLVLGSVSAEIIDHAPCPVLVARQPTLERIVFATDGSETAAKAQAILADWPIFAAHLIRVVSVADVVRPWTTGIAPTMYTQVLRAYANDLAEAESTHLEIAREAAQSLANAGRQAEPEMRRGYAAAEIISVAEAWGADLVVVGSRGRTGLKRIILGSVARNVLLGTNASVLVFRGPTEAPPVLGVS